MRAGSSSRCGAQGPGAAGRGGGVTGGGVAVHAGRSGKKGRVDYELGHARCLVRLVGVGGGPVGS